MMMLMVLPVRELRSAPPAPPRGREKGGAPLGREAVGGSGADSVRRARREVTLVYQGVFWCCVSVWIEALIVLND